MKLRSRFIQLCLVVVAGAVLLQCVRIYSRRYYIWLPNYVAGRFAASEPPARGPVHLLVFYGDHFEPSVHTDIVQRWLTEYPALAKRHRDSTGRVLQHTWFYPGEQKIDANLEALATLVKAGYGEVELHYHHGHETEKSEETNLVAILAWFQRYGFLKSADGATHFGFIHGNNGLDNSISDAFCGVNREITVLRKLGCYADFTFPALYTTAQPNLANTIFEATDDDRPKSYARGVPLQVGTKPSGDLLIFEGPLTMRFTPNPVKLFMAVEDANIHSTIPVTEERVDGWVRAGVHVHGRPEWVFVKLWGHAAADNAEATATLGPAFDHGMTYLEQRYNDGSKYVLHYVTAREAYNVARAAQSGREGDPSAYYDFEMPRYVADPPRTVGVK